MMMRHIRRRFATLGLTAGLGLALLPARAQADFNLISVEQEIELGRRAAADAERQLPILRDSSTQDFASDVLQRLARHAPGGRYPYQIKVVNASDINAFALPGGFMYVNRGLIEAVRSEGELAGVLAHEMAHIAERHATENISKQYATQAGIGVLGGLLGLGRSRGVGGQVANVLGSIGMAGLFMKFSRNAEHEADRVGARIMHSAGYDPMDMARFFDLLQSQRQRNPGKVQQFFASHPPASDRAVRIRQVSQSLGAFRASNVGGLQQVQSELRSMSPAPTMQQIARGQAPRGGQPTYRGPVRVERPSTRFRAYQQRDGFFSLNYPDNWRVHEADAGYGVTIVPEGGVFEGPNGAPSIVYGVIVNHYDPFDQGSRRGATTLDRATSDIVAQVQRSNTHLRQVRGSQRRQRLDGMPALSVVLSGRSAVTGEEERVTVFTRELEDQHVLYSLFIAPGRDYSALRATFDQMIRSLRVNDYAVHR